MSDTTTYEEYCEASLDLSNQDDVGEEPEVDEYGYPLKLGDFYASFAESPSFNLYGGQSNAR